MNLNEKLTEMRERSAERTPDDIKNIMNTAADKLSNKTFHRIQVGEKLPEFELKTVEGEAFTNESIKEDTIITFYRGNW